MAQEFTINSQAIETKINQLLPSQGGSGAGVDFSASTMVIPIVDLTESATGSQLRQDLQTCLSYDTSTVFTVNNTTTSIITTTGYYRVFGNIVSFSSSPTQTVTIKLNNGFATKVISTWKQGSEASSGRYNNEYFDFIVFLEAGHSLDVTSSGTSSTCSGVTRQIATISGDLVNP